MFGFFGVEVGIVVGSGNDCEIMWYGLILLKNIINRGIV